VQSVTYSNPARVITADACFSGNIQGTANGLASCAVAGTTAHYSIGATLPRARNVKISYQGPTSGTGLASNKYIALVEQTLGAQTNNPCRKASIAAAAANSAGGAGTGGQDSEGGARLHSGPLNAPSGSKVVTIPQQYSGSALVAPQNFLDLTKTYAVCYTGGDGSVTDGDCTSNTVSGCSNNGRGGNFFSTVPGGWRDSYIRVTLSRMGTLSMVHSGHHLVDVTTVGTFSNVPSLEVQWDGSLLHNQWIRFTASTVNGGKPCDKSQHALTASDTSVAKLSSLAGSRRATFDTTVLANTAKVDVYFAVCYATGDGGATDATWRDSAIRLRFIRWTNPGKHRVVSGAPVRLTFGVNAGFYDNGKDKVVFLWNKTNCDTAPSAPALSNGMQVSRTVDFFCSKVNNADSTSACDSNFDGVFNEKCVLGSLCKPQQGVNGGCGSSGICSAGVQLPTGKTYNEVQDTAVLKETALVEGTYAMCVCLGKTGATTISGSHTILNLADVSNTSYGPPNGDGGCNAANEYTLVSGAGNSLKVISEPKLGRFADTGDVQGTLRAIKSKSLQYQIRTTDRTAGYQVQNNDKIYFFPAALGCGHKTRYSGVGTHVYDHATNAYVSSGVDRRWRTEVRHMCTAVGTSNVGSNCDTNNDGVFAETCAVGASCNINNPHSGGCGSGGGACGSVIPSSNNASWTSPIAIANYDAATNAALFSTPAGANALATAGDYVACFTTSEALSAIPNDSTDYVPLTHGLEVITEPRLGPQSAPGNIHAVENSSPSFTVNSFKDQDLYFFMPQDQYSNAASHLAAVGTEAKRQWVKNAPSSGVCTRHVCTTVGGSSIGNNCDADFDGRFNDACSVGVLCNDTNPNHGGCGTNGRCEQRVPTVGTTMYTGLIAGSDFSVTNGAATGKLTLPSAVGKKLAVPLFSPYPSAWYLVACVIPAGSTKIVSNVHQLPDKLTIFQEPTEALLTSWFQYQVAELRFTQPQQGTYGQEAFAGGQTGDIVVLQKDNCNDVHSITPETYYINSATKSRKMTLMEAGGVTHEDEKGGTASDVQLAQGAVNELSPGIYKICYATKSSEGESASDYKMLAKTIEILPPPATKPTMSMQRSIILGQDMVASWASNIGLQTRRSKSNSWLGLYKKGDCATGEQQHQCHIAYQFIAQDVNTGTVIFSQKDYKVSGEYEIRYFDGDTRNGQGEVCGGLPNVDHETYIRCTLNAAATSETITVLSNDIADTEDLSSKPGMEAVFGNGNRGRYHRTKQY
jgi:hypothetical protein